MTTRTITQQVDHVLAGRDVLGRPSHPPFVGGLSDQIRTLLDINTELTFFRPGPRLNVAMRTAFIRKLTTFIVRSGSSHNAIVGCMWFRAHPELITSRLSLKGAIRESLDEQHRARHAAEEDRRRAMLTLMRNVPYPSQPLRFQHGAFTVHECVHPWHLLEVGRAVGNCLILRREQGGIPNTNYWERIKSGKLMLYTLRHADDICAVFSVMNGQLSEYQEYHRRVGLARAFAAAMKAMDITLRPLDYPSNGGENARYWPLMLPYGREAMRALAGKVEGQPPLNPIRLPATRNARRRLLSNVHSFVAMTPQNTSCERQFMARKFATYILANPAEPDPSYTTMHALTWFAANRSAITGPTDIETAADRSFGLPSDSTFSVSPNTEAEA